MGACCGSDVPPLDDCPPPSPATTAHAAAAPAEAVSSDVAAPPAPKNKRRLLELLAKATKKLNDPNTVLTQSEKTAVQDVLLCITESAAEPGSIEFGNAQLRRAWDACCAAVGVEQLGLIFYEEFFQTSQSLRDALFASTDMKAQSRAVVTTVKTALRLLHQPLTLQAVLERMGAQHAQYGAETYHYALLGPVGVATMRRVLGPDAVTPDIEREWNRVYSHIAETMVRAGKTPAAMGFRRKLVRSRCGGFIKVFNQVLLDRYGNSIERFVEEWLDASIPRMQRANPSELVRKGVQARPVELLRQLFTVHLPAAATTGDTHDNVLTAVCDELASALLVWMRVCVKEGASDDGVRRSLMARFADMMGASPTACEPTETQPQQQDATPGSPALDKMDVTNVSWVVNTLSEGLRGGMSKLQATHPMAPLAAPLGLVACGIEGYSVLLEQSPEPLREALDQHRDMMQGIARKHRAYVARMQSDDGVCIFAGATVERLLAAAVDMQLRLNECAVPEGLAVAAVRSESRGRSFKAGSLRIKVAIHWCSNVVAQGCGTRFDYSGPGVAEVMSLSSLAHGGQLLLSDTALERLHLERGNNKASAMPSATCKQRAAALGKSGSSAPNCSFSVAADSLALRGAGRRFKVWAAAPDMLRDRTFPATLLEENNNNEEGKQQLPGQVMEYSAEQNYAVL